MPIDRFARAQDGAVAVITALVLTVLMGFVALGIDLGMLYRDQVRLQTHADLAAIAAVADLAQASPRAGQTATGNGLTAEQVTGVSFGRFRPDPAIAPEARLIPLAQTAAGVNAVTVAVTRPTPLAFSRMFLDQDSVQQTATATAMQARGASFSLGSGLARLDQGVVNTLLANTVGGHISLSALDHSGLVAADIGLLALLEALALDVDLEAANYTDILALQVPLPDLIRAIGGAQEDAALAALVNGIAAAALQTLVPLERLISLAAPDLGVTVPDFLDSTQISALGLLAAALDVEGSDRAVDLDVGLTLGNLLSLDASVLVREPAQGSGFVAVGEEGATVHTAQTRLRAQVAVAPGTLGVLGLGVKALSLDLPLYLEIANARATLTEIDCRAEGETPYVRFQTGTGLDGDVQGPHVAELFLGHFSEARFTSASGLRPADLAYADLVRLEIEVKLLFISIKIPLLTVQARSHVFVGQSDTDTLHFTRAQIAQGTAMATIGSGDYLGSAVESLLSGVDLRIKPGDTTLVGAAVAPVVNLVLDLLPDRLLGGVAGIVDGVLEGLLAALGLELGVADLTVHEVHCSAPVLVR